MSLLSGLRSRLRGLFGGGSDDTAEGGETGDVATDEAASAGGPVCSVCGTRADPDAEACPLCGSTDLRTAEAADESGRGSRAADPLADRTVREESSASESASEPSESSPSGSESQSDSEPPSGLAPDRARQTRVDGRTDDDAVDRLKELADERRAAEADDDGQPGGDEDAHRSTSVAGDGDAKDGSESGSGSGDGG